MNELWVILIFIFLTKSEPKHVTGSISSAEDWIFIERFCFMPQNGRLQFKFSYPSDSSTPKLLTYFDDQWPLVYKNNDKSCRQKEAILKPENNQVFYLSFSEGWSGCKKQQNGSAMILCQGSLEFLSSRERWWYVVVSNCDSRLEFSYEMIFTNGDVPLQKQFSADEFYILEVDIAFLLATFVLLMLSLISAVFLHELKYLHLTYKLFICSVTFYLLHLFVMTLVLGKFSSDGLDNYSAKVLAYILEATSLLLLVLMLIFMAKGLTITRGRISMGGSVKISIFMTLYTIIYAALFIWEALAFDRGLVLYRFESFPGYCLLVMRLIAWLWFCYAIFFTLKHYPEKKGFYYPFFVLYTLWFWAGPAMVIIASKALPLWLREKVANGIFLCINFLGFSFLLFLARPSKANKNFPYHVKTTQVATMEIQKTSDLLPYDHQTDDNRLGNSRRISPTIANSDFYDIFSVSGNQSTFKV